MDLERRVKSLEQEVEILKNQIQETLLDIQDKVLTNTYPSLRADGSATPSDEGGGYERGTYPQAHDVSVQRVSAKPPESHGQPTNHHRQKVVSLESIGGMPRHNGSSALQPQPAEVDWERLEALEQWTLNKIERIGPNKTYKLLKSYLEQGRIDQDTFDALVALAKVYAQPKKKKQKPEAHQTAPSRQSQKPTSRQATKSSSNGHARRTASQRPTPQPQPDDEEDGGRHNLILRLIAGVSNASVGMSKGKKNG